MTARSDFKRYTIWTHKTIVNFIVYSQNFSIKRVYSYDRVFAHRSRIRQVITRELSRNAPWVYYNAMRIYSAAEQDLCRSPPRTFYRAVSYVKMRTVRPNRSDLKFTSFYGRWKSSDFVAALTAAKRKYTPFGRVFKSVPLTIFSPR